MQAFSQWINAIGLDTVIGILSFVILVLLVILFWVIKTSRAEKNEVFDAFRSFWEQEREQGALQTRRDLADEINKANSALRIELSEGMSNWSASQSNHLVKFAELVQKMNAQVSENSAQVRSEMTGNILQMTQGINAELAGIRETLNRQLQTLQANNDSKLEQMRQTVEVKLQTTLETRLSESFRQVATQLKDVENGLGEMRALAGEVGELKRVLTNVKTRGTFGEVQLGNILENVLPGHYLTNVVTRPGSTERVEFALELPGEDSDHTVLMPIDSKFPMEDYLKMEQARDDGNADEVEKAGKALENRLKSEAKKIHDKYVEVPYTTEFAILFLPCESLYAECLRRPGLVEELQTKYRITVAGPTVLTALLNSLQMGFRTLAIQKRSAEVWTVLGNVKMEFERFAAALEQMDKRVDTVKSALQNVKVRTTQMSKKLKDVQQLPQSCNDDETTAQEKGAGL